MLGHFTLWETAHFCSHLYHHLCQVELFHMPPVSSRQVIQPREPFWNPFLPACLSVCLADCVRRPSIMQVERERLRIEPSDGQTYKERFIVLSLIIYKQDAFIGCPCYITNRVPVQNGWSWPSCLVCVSFLLPGVHLFVFSLAFFNDNQESLCSV